MWDKFGFRDAVANEHGMYATYKLALWLLLQKRLKRKDSIDNQCRKYITQCQNVNTGGIYTDYVPIGDNEVEPSPGCDTNSETSSFCLLGE